MKISISKSIIENILIQTQPFLEKKDTSQITSHIFLEAKDNQLHIRATEYDIGLSITLSNISIEQEGLVTANGKKFLDIIKNLKDSDVNLELKNDNLHIWQSTSKFKLPIFNPNDYPTFPSHENKPKVSIESSTLIESLKKITPAIDTNNPKFELNGALVDIKDNSINFVATDTRRLAVVTIDSNITQDLSIIIPKKAIVEIQKLFVTDIELFYDDTHLIICSSEHTFFTKLINGKFPEYSRIIPKEIKHNLTLKKSEIQEALKQITTISLDVKITFSNNNILFESLSDDNIEAKTEIESQTQLQEPFTIAVNSRYINDFLSNISSNEFILSLNEPNLPFTLSNSNFKTIVMPIII